MAKLPSEVRANRKLATDLVSKWSRPIFEKATTLAALKAGQDEDQAIVQKAKPKKLKKVAATSKDAAEFGMKEQQQASSEGDKEHRVHAAIPQRILFDFTKRPQSKIELSEGKVEKAESKKRILKNSKGGSSRKTGQAYKVSVEGRGLVHYD
eukprot:scaffold1626_cov372-Prasinococcus_capsulatus_cf.AAC.15